VDGVLCFLLWAEVSVASLSAVRDEQAGALIAAVGDGRGAAADPVDAGLSEGPAVVAAAGQREADRHQQRPSSSGNRQGRPR